LDDDFLPLAFFADDCLPIADCLFFPDVATADDVDSLCDFFFLPASSISLLFNPSYIV
jgi:hypothetical protein